MEARRREPFEREPGERTEPRLIETAATVPERLDLVRWGPTWAGFFLTLAVTALLMVLGAAIGLSAGVNASATTPGATALNIWAPISLIIGLFIGGYVMMRLAAIGGLYLSLLHGALLWGVTLIFGSLLAALGLGALFGGAPAGLPGIVPGVPPGGVVQTTAGMAWVTFISLIIGLGAALLGAWLGDQARRPYRGVERFQRPAA